MDSVRVGDTTNAPLVVTLKLWVMVRFHNTILMAIVPTTKEHNMRSASKALAINPGDTVQCHDQKVYDVSHAIDNGHYLVAVSPSGSGRLFKPNGQYAGGDRTKNVARVI